jgi:alpha-1,6-mannosyltransferase
VLVGICTWLMLVFQPDGSVGLYTFPHVLLATFAAVVAGISLIHVDPLRVRSVKGREKAKAAARHADEEEVGKKVDAARLEVPAPDAKEVAGPAS